MKIKIPEELFAPKEADPKKVRKKLLSKRKTNMKVVAFIFCIAVLFLSVLSVFVIKSETKKETDSSTLNVSQLESTVFEETVKSSETQPFNILLAFTKDSNEGLQLLCILHADANEQKLKVTYIPTDAKMNVNNYDGTMESHLKSGGITELLWAVGEYTGTSIPYYIYCDENGFSNIMRYLGDTEITAKEDISHNYNGINFIIEKGTQTLTADSMLKYFVYLCDNENELQNDIAKLFSTMGKKFVSPENPNSVSESFNAIVNSINTNISAIDIANNLSLILSFAKSGSLDEIEVYSSADEF